MTRVLNKLKTYTNKCEISPPKTYSISNNRIIKIFSFQQKYYKKTQVVISIGILNNGKR